MRYIIVDIDGTVADSRHRSHHIQLDVGKRVKDGEGRWGEIVSVDHTSFKETMFEVLWDGVKHSQSTPHSDLWRWGNVDFDAWDRDAMDDTPIQETIMVLDTIRHSLGPAVKFLFLTARGEGGRPETEAWLSAVGGLYRPEQGDLLLMRDRADGRKDTDLKRDTLLKLREGGHEFLFAFEDRRLVAQMMRELGIFVFHVADYD